jgi:hypothetical protein
MVGDKSAINKKQPFINSTLCPPDASLEKKIFPKLCPCCHGRTFQRWGKVAKPDTEYPTPHNLSLSKPLLFQWAALTEN